MGTMIEDKGAEYVAAWPRSIARAQQCSPEHVVRALNEVIGTSITSAAAYGGEVIPEVAQLTPAQGRQVVAAVRRILDGIQARRDTHCHHCGLPLRQRQCAECA